MPAVDAACCAGRKESDSKAAKALRFVSSEVALVEVVFGV